MDTASVMSESSTHGGTERNEENKMFEYFGWVYHVGVNSIGHDYCHLRFLFIRGKCVAMYKRDPHEHPGIKPIRQGVVGPTLVVEELGCRRINNGDLHVIRFYNRLDESKKGEVACATAGEAQRWIEAFDHAKQQAEYELTSGGSARDKLNKAGEINLEGHRPRMRRYASGLKKFIRIGQGPETLLRQSSKFCSTDGFEVESGDAFDPHQWKCVRTMAGIRVFEDVSNRKNGKGVLAKSVGVIDATADSVFEVFLNTEQQKRYEWDMLMGDLELVESYDGHYDVVYGTYDPKYLTRWHSKRDFVFSRQWFRGQDGTYTILQFPAIHKKKPPRSGYRRTKINRLKEYIGANPAVHQLQQYATTDVHSKISDASMTSAEYGKAEVQDEFYDAIAAESSTSDEESDEELDQQEHKVTLKNISGAITTLDLKQTAAPDKSKELDPHVTPVTIDASGLHGSLSKGKDDSDTNCWTSPSGKGFMIRGKNYLKDNSKIVGGDPLFKLIAVDWLKVNKSVDRIALHPRSLVQSEAGKKLPFILVFNLQVPAKPNYSLVHYFASDRPINKDSLLAKFLDGSNSFRDSRFKLIPSIIEGYWMVKRAVGTKACMMGKAVTCNYFRQDNFLEIDVDIGSSSVARSVVGLVLGYVTSLVVDLAILIEAKEEEELPEYILGTVRLNRVRLESAVQLED
ncbi:unnamed protein product [Lupinus luteus]|uniref:START domain-containing protein n=1 Tax=Lupinus luteus TaxID=3873 RepID=A0AAV1XEG1_LUPLU